MVRQVSVHPKKFNKYADATLVDLTNPLVQTAAKHFLGGDTQSTQYELSQSIAPWRLAQDLMRTLVVGRCSL
jgi:hypothetical protein